MRVDAGWRSTVSYPSICVCGVCACVCVFCRYVQAFNLEDPRTHKGYDLNRMTMAELYKQYDLNEDTTDFIGP